jgi:hypothetical protein
LTYPHARFTAPKGRARIEGEKSYPSLAKERGQHIVDVIIAEGQRTREITVSEREGYLEKGARVKWWKCEDERECEGERGSMGGCRGGRKRWWV